MQRRLLASVGFTARAAGARRRLPPSRAASAAARAGLRAVLHLERLLRRHQRRLRLRQLELDRHRHQVPPATSTSMARWSAAPSATTCSSALSCSASRATSAGATSRARPRSCVATCETTNDWLGTARGRRLRLRPLPALRHRRRGVRRHRGHGRERRRFSKTTVGWTAGGGLEYAFLDNWSAKVEYLYVDLGTATCTRRAPAAIRSTSPHTTQIVRGGLNYKF